MSDPAAGDEARVIRAVRATSGDDDTAEAWFRHTPLVCFGDRTALQLVRDGRTEDVLHYVASLDAGYVG